MCRGAKGDGAGGRIGEAGVGLRSLGRGLWKDARSGLEKLPRGRRRQLQVGRIERNWVGVGDLKGQKLTQTLKGTLAGDAFIVPQLAEVLV